VRGAYDTSLVGRDPLPTASTRPKQQHGGHMTQEQLKLFYEILETKNSWGKNEIKTLLLEIASGIRTRK